MNLLQFFSALSADERKEVMLISAAGVTLVGVWLCWLAPYHRMSAEENAKDGLLTDEEARRKINRVAWTGPLVTFLGLAAVGGILMR